MAVQALRRYLLQHKLFVALTGEPSFWPGRLSEPFDLEQCKEVLAAALKDANRVVYNAARTGAGRRGMGCTAEVVYVQARHLLVGHVGDSRTYHLRRGEMIQVTRDQTLVNRLVELGHLSEDEALTHPRRSELQQAIGGYAEVDPALYQSTIHPGDWVVVCSDGLSNHVAPDEMKEMLQRAASAETAARRLVNLANLLGATDNATVVVIRAT
jgi:protein phosphatase